MKLLHSMIRVKDIEKSLKFYQELLGLKLTHTMNLDDCKLYYMEDEITGVEIELTHNFKIPENGYEKGTQFGHFAFEVASMNEFSVKLHAFGLEYSCEPFEIKAGIKIAFFEDPDGREIEVIEASR